VQPRTDSATLTATWPIASIAGFEIGVLSGSIAYLMNAKTSRAAIEYSHCRLCLARPADCSA
jgi:hypothetical protein